MDVEDLPGKRACPAGQRTTASGRIYDGHKNKFLKIVDTLQVSCSSVYKVDKDVVELPVTLPETRNGDSLWIRAVDFMFADRDGTPVLPPTGLKLVVHQGARVLQVGEDVACDPLPPSGVINMVFSKKIFVSHTYQCSPSWVRIFVRFAERFEGTAKMTLYATKYQPRTV